MASFTVIDSQGSQVDVKGVNDLINDVDSLTADGGGDCPEYGMTAIIKTIELIDGIQRNEVQNSGKHNIIVLTDASAKDDDLYETVINKANSADAPSVTVHFFYSGGGCSDVGFGHYEDVKNATGGYSVNQINAENFLQFVSFISSSYEIEKRNTPASCQYFQISYFVKKFSNLLETSQSNITITKPDLSTETVTTFSNSFAVYKVIDPQPGQWQACVSSGTLQQSLSIVVDLDLKIDFLKESDNGELLPTNEFPFMCKYIKPYIILAALHLSFQVIHGCLQQKLQNSLKYLFYKCYIWT